jgi:hypothetical protein
MPSPKSNPQSRGIITRIVQRESGMLPEMAIIFGMGTRTGNNLQSVRKQLARSCKLESKLEEKVSGTKVP